MILSLEGIIAISKPCPILEGNTALSHLSDNLHAFRYSLLKFPVPQILVVDNTEGEPIVIHS